MILRIIGGAVLFILGLALLLLGIMFIIASDNEKRRVITGIILSPFGLLLLVFGIRFFREGLSLSPQRIREKILKLAAQNHGELPENVIMGEIGKSDILDFQLISMINSGIAKKTFRDGQTFFLFSQFNMKLIVKQCPYCGNDYPVRDDIETCSSCGGDLRVSIERKVDEDNSYSMD